MNILSLIPQRPPFVMIDRVLHAEEGLTRTSFRPAPGNIFVENGYFTEPGLVENIAQTAAAGAGLLAGREGRPVLVAYIGAIRQLDILHLPTIGEELITEVRIMDLVMGVTVVRGRIWHEQNLIVECEMTIFPAGEKADQEPQTNDGSA